MSGDFKAMDARDWTIELSGVSLTDGYADGEFFTIKWDSPAYVDKVGANGEVVRSRTYDDRATITLKFMATSTANDRASALHELDKTLPNGAGAGACFLRDREGRTAYISERAWVKGKPGLAGSTEAATREWEIRCSALVGPDGGRG